MTLVLEGMHGLGDNVHQRAILRHLLAQPDPVSICLNAVALPLSRPGRRGCV